MSLTDKIEAEGFDLKALLDPDAASEVTRVMQICNACRYCEGFCAVFPAMTRRRSFVAPVIMRANIHRRMNLA